MNSTLQKPHFKILVIGNTGSGKTTFVNMVVNLAKGKEYTDEKTVAIKQSDHWGVKAIQQSLRCALWRMMNTF